jgi:hypothetical protein
MSTPIQELSGKSSNAAAAPDPEVLSVLNEMEQEMAAARTHHVVHTPHPKPVQQVMPPAFVPSAPLPMHVKPKSFVQPELMQKVGIIAFIALVIFYPETLRVLYNKLPAYETIFASYDTLIRAAIFAVVLYLLVWKNYI